MVVCPLPSSQSFVQGGDLKLSIIDLIELLGVGEVGALHVAVELWGTRWQDEELEVPLPARFLGALDLFVLWWALVLGIGVALLYRKPARPTALAFMGAYVGVAALLAIAMAVSGGTV